MKIQTQQMAKMHLVFRMVPKTPPYGAFESVDLRSGPARHAIFFEILIYRFQNKIFVTKKVQLDELKVFTLKTIFIRTSMAPRGSKSAKNGRKFINFWGLEFYQVTEGSDKVALDTKKFHPDKLKLFCLKTFFS